MRWRCGGQHTGPYLPVFPVGIDDDDTCLDSVEVNHKTNSSQWIVPGTYAFNGIPGVVIISEKGCTACADAVRFISLG